MGKTQRQMLIERAGVFFLSIKSGVSVVLCHSCRHVKGCYQNIVQVDGASDAITLWLRKTPRAVGTAARLGRTARSRFFKTCERERL